MLPTAIVPIWLLIWKFVQADIKSWDKCWPLRNQNHAWKCQVTSLIWPIQPSLTSPVVMQTASLPLRWARTHTHTHSENVTKTGIQRIIGRRCRCAGCRAPRPENSEMCFEWQVEVSHTGTAGHNDISAWQSYTTRGGRRKECQRAIWCEVGIWC